MVSDCSLHTAAVPQKGPVVCLDPSAESTMSSSIFHLQQPAPQACHTAHAAIRPLPDAIQPPVCPQLCWGVWLWHASCLPANERCCCAPSCPSSAQRSLPMRGAGTVAAASSNITLCASVCTSCALRCEALLALAPPQPPPQLGVAPGGWSAARCCPGLEWGKGCIPIITRHCWHVLLLHQAAGGTTV